MLVANALLLCLGCVLDRKTMQTNQSSSRRLLIQNATSETANAPGELPRAPTPPNRARCAGNARLQPQGQLPIAVLSTEGNPHRAEEHWHIYQRAARIAKNPRRPDTPPFRRPPRAKAHVQARN